MTATADTGVRGGDPPTERQAWMSALAQAAPADLEAAVAALSPPPDYRLLRRPETGMALVRGRMGGTGAPFNMGEMTLTRCSVEADGGAVGHGYVAGRAPRHAELAAVLDALFQDPDEGAALRGRVLPRLAADAEARRRRTAAEAASTRVDFFTLVRGEDEE